MIHSGGLFLLIFLAVGAGLKGPLLLMQIISKRKANLRTLLQREDEIEAVNCRLCGYYVEGADNEELFDQLQIHIEQDHPDSQLTDEQIGEIVASSSYAVQ